MTPAVRVEGACVSYGRVVALDHADLTVGPGRVCGLIGMNGAGKSTLMKAITGAVRLDAGTIRVGDRTPAQARRAGAVAYVPQSEAVDWDFPISVREVVATGRYGRLGLTRRLGATDVRGIDEALERVGLTDLAHRQVGRLSGGQRKRAFVARALVQDAPLVLLDEPFAGVDRTTEEALHRVIRGLADDGHTVIIATHDLHGLPRLCDEAALLMRRVLVHDRPEIVVQPANLALAFGGGAP